ncbi:MAG TPA: hypothetical protein VMT15_08365 [Bryobacteraceae bacterium]|nr:hypothetical protein [Bryobacteraceae bacterium]
MKTKLMAMLLMAGSTMFAGVRFGVGVGFGVPYAPAPVMVAAPRPGYVFVNGAWVLPPYAGAYWVGPRWYGGRYVAGYWAHGYVRPYARGYVRGYRR